MKCFPLAYASELSDKGSYKWCFFSFHKVAHTGTEKGESATKGGDNAMGQGDSISRGKLWLWEAAVGNCCFQSTACFSRLSPSTECQDNVPQITQGLPGISCEGSSSASQMGWTQTSYQARSFHAQIKHKFQKPAAVIAGHCPCTEAVGQIADLFSTKGQDTKNSTLDTFLLLFKKNPEWIQ